MEECRHFLEFFKAQVDPTEQLPVRMAGYNITESEIPGEVAYWVQQYLLPLKCPQLLLVPIINEILKKTKDSCTKTPSDCGFDGFAYNPLKLSVIVIAHINATCDRLLDNAELNEILTNNTRLSNHKPPLHYVKAIKNTRRKMEDRHVCFSSFHELFNTKNKDPTSFYGIFDGHGGQDAAIYTAAHLCYNISKSSKYPLNIDEAMREAFDKTDLDLVAKSDKYSIYSGTTAVVCLYRAIENVLYIGWVGDSQALLVSEGKVCQLVTPHLASLESERARISKMGGTVVHWEGSYRVGGQLALSRAIGDSIYKPYVTSEPDTARISLEGKEDFLIIGSDGLWESLTEDYIAVLLYREIAKNPECAESIVNKLIETAKVGTADNITVIVVFFKDPCDIAKSPWLKKMEAESDAHKNDAFDDNEISQLPVPKSSFNYSKEDCSYQVPPSENNAPEKFVGDFGPETDVDTMDDIKFGAEAKVDEHGFSNGVSLENKILQELSEQHEELSTNNSIISEKYVNPQSSSSIEKACEEEVDNKILNESCKEPECFNEIEKQDREWTPSSMIVTSDDQQEKMSTDDIDTDFEHLETEQAVLEASIVDTSVECAVSEEDEEEEEWNYFKGDKKCDEHQRTDKELNIVVSNQNQTTTAIENIDSVQKLSSENIAFEDIDTVQEVSIENSATKLLNIEFSNKDPESETPTSATIDNNYELDESLGKTELKASEKLSTIEASDLLNLEEHPNSDVVEKDIICNQTEVLEASISGQLGILVSPIEHCERPDSLSLDMASKLNPEAKEFVPTGSPNPSNPSTPDQETIPSTIQNTYLVTLSEDTVVAQSPKKGTSTMDNIDVPAEDDFKQGIHDRPCDLQESEHLNGSTDIVIAVNSPGSELSYQEMNLKESMQADEKLECEYSDEKQFTVEDGLPLTNNEIKFTNLEKNSNPMSMSFYEGRDECLISNNSDELNKVQLLPDEGELLNNNYDEISQMKINVDLNQENHEQDNGISPLPEPDEDIASKYIPPIADVELEISNAESVANKITDSVLESANQVVDEVTSLVDQIELSLNISNKADDKKVIQNSEDEKYQVEHVKFSENCPKETDLPLLPEVPDVTSRFTETCIDDKSPVVLEALQHEVTAENEFITDESVLRVQSPLSSTEIKIAEETISTNAESCVSKELSLDTQAVPMSSVIQGNIPILEPEVTKLVPVDGVEKSILNDVKEDAPVTAVAKSPSKPKSSTLKGATKPSIGATKLTRTLDKKPSASTDKPGNKAIPPKPAALNAPKKPSTASASTSLNIKSTTKSTLTTSARPSVSSNSKSISIAEKKAPLSTAKKLSGTPTNGEIVPNKKPMMNSKSAPTKTTITSSSSITRPAMNASTVSKSNSTGITKPQISSRQPSTTTARPSSATSRLSTSTTLPSAKPRAVTATAGRVSAPPSASASSVTSKTSQISSAAGKRNTNAQKASNITSTINKTSQITSRTSTAPKVSSGMAARKSTTATMTKKNASPLTAKTGTKIISATVVQKETVITNTISADHTNGSMEKDSYNLLHLDKQTKNDGNNYLTNNGTDSQMMVIDSAAD